MSSTALRTFALVLIVLAVLFGVAAYYMNRQIETAPDAEVSQPLPEDDRVLAVVAVEPLTPYEPVTEEDVALVPISVEPAQYYTDVADVVGREPVRGVATGSPVTDEAFGRPNALAQAIPPDTQAMSLSISDVIAVGGFVQPGDFVDVLIYLRSSGDQVESSQSRILLENVRVLAYHEQLINGEADGGDDGGGRRERTAVVAVPMDKTTRVMLGASLGELRLSLRPPPDEPAADGADTAEERLAAADGRSEGDDAGAEAMPEPVAPTAEAVALADADGPVSVGDESAEPKADAENKDEDEDADERVVTLAELARIEDEQEADDAPAPAPARRRPAQAPQPTIEVYEGSSASRISRPY